MPRTQNLASRYLAEVISYGGFPVTRATAHELARQALGTAKGADWFAFGPGVQEWFGVAPMTADEVRAEMEKIENNP